MKRTVQIIVGSQSDLAHMRPCAELLDAFSVPFDITIASAHRTPKRVHEVIKRAEGAGVKVFIAAAGMAAHLPGVVASITVRPVIGVPIEGGALNGIDALFSIVQMPAGIPVAAVALGSAGAKNSALLAVGILAADDVRMREKLVLYRKKMARSVSEAAEELRRCGYAGYVNKPRGK